MEPSRAIDMSRSDVTPDPRCRQTETSFSNHDLTNGCFAHHAGYPDVAQFADSENVAASLGVDMTVLSPRHAPTHGRDGAAVSPYGNTIDQATLASWTGSTTTDLVLNSSGSETITSPRSVWSPHAMAAPMWEASFAEQLVLSGSTKEAEDGWRGKEPAKKNKENLGSEETDAGETQAIGKQKGVSLASKPLKKKRSPVLVTPTSPTASPRRPSRGQHRRNLTATTTNTVAPDDGEDRDHDNRGLKYGKKPDQRERNRIAATKCRVRSKAAVKHLEIHERAMSDSHNKLVAERDELRIHVLDLRELLLQHGNCGCELVRTYVQNAARRIAETGGRYPIWGVDGTGGRPVRLDYGQGHHGLEGSNDGEGIEKAVEDRRGGCARLEAIS